MLDGMMIAEIEAETLRNAQLSVNGRLPLRLQSGLSGVSQSTHGLHDDDAGHLHL